MAEKKMPPTICWKCSKALGKCPWSRVSDVTDKVEFQPIPGWEAIPTVINMYDPQTSKTHPERSYLVVKCPLFEPDGKKYKREGKEDSVDVRFSESGYRQYIGKRLKDIEFRVLDVYKYHEMIKTGYEPVYLLTDPKNAHYVLWAGKTLGELAKEAGSKPENILRTLRRKPKNSMYHIAWVFPQDLEEYEEE